MDMHIDYAEPAALSGHATSGEESVGEETCSVRGPQLRSPEQTRARLFQTGSFRGSQPNGDWPVDQDGLLLPHIALRLRFEYYLLGLGEVSVAELRHLVADEARSALGAEMALHIMHIWDRYWQLRTHGFQSEVDANDVSTWLPALHEQQAVRRQILGPNWAQAFYAEEERYFEDFVAQVMSIKNPSAVDAA